MPDHFFLQSNSYCKRKKCASEMSQCGHSILRVHGLRFCLAFGAFWILFYLISRSAHRGFWYLRLPARSTNRRVRKRTTAMHVPLMARYFSLLFLTKALTVTRSFLHVREKQVRYRAVLIASARRPIKICREQQSTAPRMLLSTSY